YIYIYICVCIKVARCSSVVLLSPGSSAKALVSLREGSLSNSLNEKNNLPKSQTTRGRSGYVSVETPTRSSKRSRLSCEDEERPLASRSPRRSQRVTTVPQKLTNVTTPDKRASQKIGLRLRNLLKLPKAHKWCIYEWFYSNIDRCVLQTLYFQSLCAVLCCLYSYYYILIILSIGKRE
ncbi:hypothetical protein cypCar_00050210, partial [Cyprinus carpio]